MIRHSGWVDTVGLDLSTWKHENQVGLRSTLNTTRVAMDMVKPLRKGLHQNGGSNVAHRTCPHVDLISALLRARPTQYKIVSQT